MLKNFLLITTRKLRQNQGGTVFNLLSLSLGMASCLFIFQYVFFEFTYDQFHKSSDQLFRVETQWVIEEIPKEIDALSEAQVGAALTEKFDEIEASTRLTRYSDNGAGFFRHSLNEKETTTFVEKVFFAENSIFDLFSIDFMSRDNSNLLSEPNTIIISRLLAEKLKPDARPESLIGSSVKTGREGVNEKSYRITGVFEPFPPNSHLHFDALISYSSMMRVPVKSLSNYTYLKLKKNLNSEALAARASEFIYPKNFVANDKILSFRPIGDIHLHANVSNEPEAGASTLFLTFLAVIGVLILILACTNYINSAIINSIGRAKEIGIRKLLGIKPHELILTFLGEAFLINLLAAILAVLLFTIGVKMAGIYTDVLLEGLNDMNLLSGIIFMCTMVVTSTLVSGLYPAFFLSSLKPIESLKGKIQVANSRQSSKGSKIVRFLLVFQLTMSVIFLSSVYIVYRQLQHIKSHDSFPQELRVTAKYPGLAGSNKYHARQSERYINKAIKNTNILGTTPSNLFKGQLKTTLKIRPLSTIPDDSAKYQEDFHLFVIDHAYWKDSSDIFIKGENFPEKFGAAPNEVIINQAAMRFMGFVVPDSIIGRRVGKYNGFYTVRAVVHDASSNAAPSVYVSGYSHPTYFDMLIETSGRSGERIQASLNQVATLWSNQFQNFYFLDANYGDELLLEKGILKLFFFFSLIAIVIACVGMFGLSSFTTYKRTKEIGIRKILGASTQDILRILLLDFLILVVYASAFALPIVVLGAKEWLTNYPMRIPIGPGVLTLPVIVILWISFLMIGRKCWETAVSNPIDSLELS